MEYGIVSKPSTLRNHMTNAILEWINQVLVNLERNCNITQTYVDKDDPWSGILDEAAFSIFSTKNRLKSYSLGQLVFVCDMILPIKHTMHWESISHQNQRKIIKIISAKIETELTTTIKSEIKLCSITTPHKNMKLHIRAL